MRAMMGERSEVPDFVKTPKFAGALNLFDCKMVGVKFVFKFMYIFFDNIYYIYSQDFYFLLHRPKRKMRQNHIKK
jgi:hypothetical protein